MPVPFNTSIPAFAAGYFPGCYSFDQTPGYVTSTDFMNSDIFSFCGVVTPSHQSYQSLGPSLTADFLDPTSYGDRSMRNRLTCFDMANTMLYNQLNDQDFGFNSSFSGVYPV